MDARYFPLDDLSPDDILPPRWDREILEIIRQRINPVTGFRLGERVSGALPPSWYPARKTLLLTGFDYEAVVALDT